jgi:hypothetical protein
VGVRGEEAWRSGSGGREAKATETQRRESLAVRSVVVWSGGWKEGEGENRGRECGFASRFFSFFD